MKTIRAEVTRFNTFACILALCVLACGVYAVAQDSSDTNITGSGTNGTVAKFTGAHTIGNSIITLSSDVAHVAGGVAATKGGGSNENVVSGTNTSTFGLTQGSGIFGLLSTSGESGVGANWPNGGSGAWGDGGADGNYGVIGTTDGKAAGIFQNNTTGYYTLYGFNNNSSGYPFAAINSGGFGCSIDPLGDLSCTGSKNAVVPVNNGKQWVALAAVESPKNWFEDFGTGQMLGGVGTVNLDSTFIQTANTDVEYHVFLTPNGDCKGLYVFQKNATSFEVRELGGGNSSVKFDYRITALRKNYEKIRFADHSREFPASKDGSIRPPAE